MHNLFMDLHNLFMENFFKSFSGSIIVLVFEVLK